MEQQAAYTSGNGGEELDRYEQLNSLTRTLYAMSQDAPESAGAVWGRRLGLFQSAHAKRLRDSGLFHEEGEISAWPSTGTMMLLRTLGHIFPVTDRRHNVVTPAMLLLGQMVAQTPVVCTYDLVAGLLCSGLMIEFSKDAKRIAPEALAFLAGVLRLFSGTSKGAPSPNLSETPMKDFRKAVASYEGDLCPTISFEQAAIDDSSMPAAVLFCAVHLIDQCVESLGAGATDAEAFSEIANALVVLNPSSEKRPLPSVIATKATATALKLSCAMAVARQPLARRAGPT